MTERFESGMWVRPSGWQQFGVVEDAIETRSGWRLYVNDASGNPVKIEVDADSANEIEVLQSDGGADPKLLLAGLWAEWMRSAAATAKATALASTTLRPYLHQDEAVYGAMLPQPQLRFLLADEPGTGKTIMAGLYLREMQRLGLVNRALIVSPAHLVSKWQADFDRFFGGGLKRITSETVKDGRLRPDQDLWIVSLDLAAVNPAVQDTIRPDRAGWDVVVIDEAHRLTPTAETLYRVGRLLSRGTPRILLMTATPHRGKEWLFRALLHLVDPAVFPPCDDKEDFNDTVKPGPLHFVRRIKEELVDYDGVTPLFKGRRATNVRVSLNPSERAFYNQALDLVDQYFPTTATQLARMVYGKRAASSMYALARTLRRRRDLMGTALAAESAYAADPEGDDPEAVQEAEVLVADSKAARAERSAIDEVLAQLDRLLVDPEMPVSKWKPILDECLRKNGIVPGTTDQAVVFTEYADTAEWLVERFGDAGYTAERYSGRDSHAERDVIRSRFARGEFQILVSTDAGNEGIDLQSAHVLINWDIPWSLVRLEQRMGRIHRVGQTRDVELFNLIAIDTREGEALSVLLDNMVIAANRLGGKLFDSLSLVAEMVGLNMEQLLSQTFADVPSDALLAAKAITATMFQAEATKAAGIENRYKSQLDVQAATARLQAEALERVNPRIVEAFLVRLAEAGLIKLDRSALGEGIFVVFAGVLPLPSDFTTQRALVASSGTAITRAEEAGGRTSEVVRIGPAESAFRALVDGVRVDCQAALLQGAQLVDESSSTGYDLYCFETELTEGTSREPSPHLSLMRVDDAGARPVRWEFLANLRASDGSAGSPHPARQADAEEAAIADAVKERVTRALTREKWLLAAQDELRKLPVSITSSISNRDERRETRARLDAAVRDRLAQLGGLAHVSVGNTRQLGWARVEPGGPPDEPTAKDSERISMKVTTHVLRREGWRVTDVHTEGRGYDLLATRSHEQRCVEVKGVWESASSQGVPLTANEILMAGQLADDYWLYVVDRCSEGGLLFGVYRDPIALFGEQLRDVAGAMVPGSALAAARVAVGA